VCEGVTHVSDARKRYLEPLTSLAKSLADIRVDAKVCQCGLLKPLRCKELP
jgi:hypothetical protein